MMVMIVAMADCLCQFDVYRTESTSFILFSYTHIHKKTQKLYRREANA